MHDINPVTTQNITSTEVAVLCLDPEECNELHGKLRSTLEDDKCLYSYCQVIGEDLTYLAYVDGQIMLKHVYFIPFDEYEQNKKHFNYTFVLSHKVSKEVEETGRRNYEIFQSKRKQ